MLHILSGLLDRVAGHEGLPRGIGAEVDAIVCTPGMDRHIIVLHSHCLRRDHREDRVGALADLR